MLGLLGGVVGFAFVKLIALLLNLGLLGEVGWELPSLGALESTWRIPAVAVAGAFVVALLAAWAPSIRGHGIPEAMEAVLVRQSRVGLRTAVAKPVGTAIAIGSGAPFGAEGPIIVTGGALGSLLGQLVPVSPSERKILLSAGAAAGMSAVFGTPIAAVILAIELLLFEFSMRALVPLVIASVLADGVHVALLERGPLFRVPVQEFAGLQTLPFYAVMGVGIGVLAVGVSKAVFASETAFVRLPIPRFWHPLLGALVFGAIGMVVPRALGVGYDVIGDVLARDLSVGVVAAVLVAKLVSWVVALGSGTSGSSLAPLLLIGAAAGGLFGEGIDRLLPATDVSPESFALVGMAALFGAAAGAPFMSFVFAFEVTREFDLILPLMLGTVIAQLVARSLDPETLMTEKLTRRGLRVSTDYAVDVLRVTAVRSVMRRDVDTIDETSTVGAARRRFLAGDSSAYPLVDEEDVISGILTRGDMFRSTHDDDTAVKEVASTDVVTVRPHTTLREALQEMADEQIRQVPVVDERGHVVGMCARADILRANLMTERVQRPKLPWWSPYPDEHTTDSVPVVRADDRHTRRRSSR